MTKSVKRNVSNGIGFSRDIKKAALARLVSQGCAHGSKAACPNCLAETRLVFDHLIPIENKGLGTLENCNPICEKCHDIKSETEADNRTLGLGNASEIVLRYRARWFALQGATPSSAAMKAALGIARQIAFAQCQRDLAKRRGDFQQHAEILTEIAALRATIVRTIGGTGKAVQRQRFNRFEARQAQYA